MDKQKLIDDLLKQVKQAKTTPEIVAAIKKAMAHSLEQVSSESDAAEIVKMFGDLAKILKGYQRAEYGVPAARDFFLAATQTKPRSQRYQNRELDRLNEKINREGYNTDLIKTAKEMNDPRLLLHNAIKDSSIDTQRTLLYLPDLLFNANKDLDTLKDGRAEGADGQSLATQADYHGQRGAAVWLSLADAAKTIFGLQKADTDKKERISKALDELHKKAVIMPLEGGGWISYPLIIRMGIKACPSNNSQKIFEQVIISPALAMSLEYNYKQAKFETSKDFVLLPPAGRYLHLLANTKQVQLFNYLTLARSYAEKDIQAAAKEGKKTKGSCEKEKLREQMNITDYSKNKARYDDDMRKAFAVMAKIGIIEAGSFGQAGDLYTWTWKAEYLHPKKRQADK